MNDTQIPSKELVDALSKVEDITGIKPEDKLKFKPDNEGGPSIPMEPGKLIEVDTVKLELRLTAAMFTHEELAILFTDAQTRYRGAKALLSKIRRMQNFKADNA